MEEKELRAFLDKTIVESYDRAKSYAYFDSKKLPLRFIFFRLEKKIKDYLEGKSEDRLILLPGLRGVGKTTLLSQIYIHLVENLGIEKERIIFVSVDELIRATGSDINTLVKSYEANYLGKYIESLDKNVFFLFDEVNYDRNWATNLKILYDRSKKVFIIATGSSALSLTSNLDLVRRATFEEVFPLNFSEYLLLKGSYVSLENLRKFVIDLIFNPSLIKEFKGEIKDEYLKYKTSFTPFDLDNFLKLYGFPFSLFREEKEACDKIVKILDRIVYEDLRKIENFDLSTLEKASKVIFLLASSPSISIDSISKQVGLSKETVSRVLNALEKCMLINSVKPFGKEEKIVKKAWKYYFVSPTLRYCIKNFLGTYREEDRGILLEDYVSSVLFRIKKTRLNFDIFYDSKKKGSNFLVKKFSEKPIPIEVKFGEKGENQLLFSMKRFNSPYGILIGNFELEFDGKILYLPKELFFVI